MPLLLTPEISKCSSYYTFDPSCAKLDNMINMINKAAIREYNVMDVLAISHELKLLWHFEILTWESTGKSPKMCNILKTADRRAKQMKILDSRSYVLNM